MTKRIRCSKATVIFVVGLAVALLGSVPGALAAGKKGGAGGSLGVTKDRCEGLGGTTGDAPGPQDGTYECCFSASECYICTPKGCDPVDWGDVASKLEDPRLSAAARPGGLSMRATKPKAPGILEQPDTRILEQPDTRILERPETGILERPERARAARDHRVGILERPMGRSSVRDYRPGGATAYQAKAPSRPGNTDGGQCSVLSGPNKGEKGTFDEGYCCDEKDWGCTDCTSTTGGDNGKCKATKQASIFERPSFERTKASSMMRAR